MSDHTTISEKTKVSLKTASAIVVAVVSVIGFCGKLLWGAWSSVDSRLSGIHRDVVEIKQAQRQNWSRAEQVEWTQDLREANPNLRVPRVRVIESASALASDSKDQQP